MLKKIVLAVLLVGIAGAAMAQTSYSLVGIVADVKGETLPFTNCVLLHEADSSFAYGTTGDMDGHLSVSNIVGGAYLLRITYMGYVSHWQRLEINENIDLGTVTLEKNTALLKEVHVTASRPLYSADGEKVFYNVGDDPSVQSGNATDALQNAPGVEVDAEGNIKYRGGAEVSIWINDKPSHLKAESLKQYLKSLPAGTLQRIEVIAHPSAKYHTQNCVVNIVTNAKVKRNELLCLGLNVNSKPQLGPWVDYVWSNEKVRFNIFVSGDYDSYSGDASNDSRLLARDSTLSSTIGTKGHSKNRTLGGNFGLDFDYNFDTSTLLNLWLWTTAAHDSSNLATRTERTEFLNNAGRYFYNDDVRNGNTMADASFGVMLEKKFDTLGGMLFVDYTGTLTRNYSIARNIRTFDSLTALNFDRRKTTLNPSQWHGVTADIAIPYNKHGELDLGLMASLSSESKDVDETVGGVSDFLRSYAYTNGTYELSLYAGAEHHFGRLTLGASLSVDNAWYSLLYSGADSGDVSKHYLAFSPTIHASYSIESMHNFTFSYTHYVAPPTAMQLTSFTVFGYDGYSIGNPSLKNGYTDNLELGWQRYFDHLGSVGVSAWYKSMRDQTGTLTDVAYCDQFGRVVAFSQPFNIGTSRNGGLGLNATLRPANFMNIRFYANLFDDYYRVQYRPGKWMESEMLCYSLRLNFWAKLWDKFQVFVNDIYRSRTQTLLAEVDPYFTIDCGISTDLFDRSLSLFLNANDIFGTVRTGGESVNPYNPSTSESTVTSQYVSLGITWRIGRAEMESQQSHGKKSGTKKSKK
ncbi:MAG: TonB-dependent receptor family protein [Bacteroidales bacterium]|nr:TonB-dependent receptor family protein [Bacteroidales bacterium]